MRVQAVWRPKVRDDLIPRMPPNEAAMAGRWQGSRAGETVYLQVPTLPACLPSSKLPSLSAAGCPSLPACLDGRYPRVAY